MKSPVEVENWNGEMEPPCSSAELYTLASLLGREALIGVPYPFPGWLTEEIQAVKARQSLMARGVLAPRGDGETVMDVVAALIGTLIAPQTVFTLTLTVPDQPSGQINIYHRPPLTVALEQREEQWHLRFPPRHCCHRPRRPDPGNHHGFGMEGPRGNLRRPARTPPPFPGDAGTSRRLGRSPPFLPGKGGPTLPHLNFHFQAKEEAQSYGDL